MTTNLARPRRHRRVRGDRTEHARLGAQQRDIGQAVPAQRHRERQTRHDLRGSCTANGLRQRANPADNARSKPDARTASTSRTPPARETTPEPAESTRTYGYDKVGFFT
jgi:hypothetical protein